MPTNFRVEIEHYLAASFHAPATFGKLAANDTNLVYEMRKGRRLRPALYERVAAFMCANVPA